MARHPREDRGDVALKDSGFRQIVSPDVATDRMVKRHG